MSPQTILLQPGLVKELLNAVKIKLHKDTRNFRYSHVQQYVKEYFAFKFLTIFSGEGSSLSYLELGNYLRFRHARGYSSEDRPGGLSKQCLGCFAGGEIIRML